MKKVIKMRYTASELKELKSKKNIVVNYNWYDHLLLRHNGEAEQVTAAIESHDFDTFKKFVDKYGKEYFPSYANIFDTDIDDFIGELYIYDRAGFNLIDGSDYECG